MLIDKDDCVLKYKKPFITGMKGITDRVECPYGRRKLQLTKRAVSRPLLLNAIRWTFLLAMPGPPPFTFYNEIIITHNIYQGNMWPEKND